MVFDVTGEVINAGTSKKNGTHFMSILVDRPDKSGKDVLLVFTKLPGKKAGEKVSLKCNALVKMAYEV